MSIVSHTLLSESVSGSRKYVTYQFTDHLSNTVTVDKLVPLDHDTNAEMLSMYTGIENSQSNTEEKLIVDTIETNSDIVTSITSPKYSTAKNLAKKVIYYMMREKDPRIVLALEPLIIYLRANYTNAQLITFLDLTSEQATKMNTRINAILDNKTAFTTFDNNAEEIE